MKVKHIVAIAIVLLPAFLLASEGAGGYEALTGRSTDYFPRVFNFLVFSGILYYLLANPIKSYFTGRQAGISNQLKEIEAKLQETRVQKREAENRVEESKKRAEEIIETAKKEAKVLVAKIEEDSKKELAILAKIFDDKNKFEERKATRETIDEVLSGNIKNSDILLSEKKVIDLISKKVA